MKAVELLHLQEKLDDRLVPFKARRCLADDDDDDAEGAVPEGQPKPGTKRSKTFYPKVRLERLWVFRPFISFIE